MIAKTEAETPVDTQTSTMTPEALAGLGGGHLAYMRTIRSEDVQRLFPQAPAIAPGLTLFTLHAADGTPILLTDNREAAFANASEHDLMMVSLH
ncbi:DUF1150 family protein [Aquabacter cavernae]|uniref:BQ00720 family protein n=1 Tax=Aquabacter cavernae TaxID=2496029 RepID=UPI000F8D8B00|nr:DUF1150 domain-containing protein [Aquabacter cavernae]